MAQINPYGTEEAWQKSRERLGDTSEKVLRWILHFASTDLPEQSAGRWLDFQGEYLAFLRYGPPAIRRKEIPWPKRGWSDGNPTAWLTTQQVSRDTVEHAQKNLRSWLDTLMQKHVLRFEPMPITLSVLHPRYLFDREFLEDSQLPEEGGCFRDFSNHHQVFAYNVAHILGAHSGRLRRCTECQTIFLVDRRQQVFCSARCLNRVTQRRWRENQKKGRRKKQSKATRGK